MRRLLRCRWLRRCGRIDRNGADAPCVRLPPKATRGVTIAVILSRERKRRQPGLAMDNPAFVGWHQRSGGIQGSSYALSVPDEMTGRGDFLEGKRPSDLGLVAPCFRSGDRCGREEPRMAGDTLCPLATSLDASAILWPRFQSEATISPVSASMPM